jgi:hypothetical protein
VTLPLSTTTISVERNVAEQMGRDPYDSPAQMEVLATGLRAVVTPPTGSAQLVGGTRVAYLAQLHCDPCDLQPEDQITDAMSGLTWTLLWASEVKALGLHFTEGQMRRVTGAT